MGLGRWWRAVGGGATHGRAVHRRRRAALARRVGAVLGKRGYTAGEIHQFWRDCVDVAALELASAE